MRIKLDGKVNDSLKKNYELSGSLKIGDVLRGKVTDKNGNMITIKTPTQKYIRALLESDVMIDKDSIIELIITNIVEGKVYAKQLTMVNKENVVNNGMESILKKLGFSVSEQNLEICKALIKYNQPINRENIEYINYLLRTIQSFNIDILTKAIKLLFCKKDIKNMPLYEINSVFYDTIDDEIKGLENIFNKDLNFTHDFVKNMGEIQNYILEHYEIKDDIKAILKGLIIDTMGIVRTLEETDLETIVFMLSKGIEVTPRNIMIYNLMNRKASFLTSCLEQLLEQLKHDESANLSLIKAKLDECYFKLEEINAKDIDDKINNLIKLLSEIEYTLKIEDYYGFEIRENLSNIKSVINIIKALNNDFNYLFIPVVINNNKTDVEIFIFERKSKRKKVDASNANIIISLNMPNIGYIESHIEIRKDTLSIVFKSENKEVTDMINNHSIRLKEAFEYIGYKKISITSISDDKSKADILSINDMLNPYIKNDYHGIDVRI